MSAEITPAMPPEEWAAQLQRTPEERRKRLRWARDEADADGYLTIHGLAALALYGQPFGFTREDVDWLDATIRLHQMSSNYDSSRDPAVSLRARIAALLPGEGS